MMSYIIRRWYDLGWVVAAGALAWIVFGGLSIVQNILLLNLIVLVLHQVEEMRWPGGSAWILNEVFNRADDGLADRYKLNQASCAFINIAAWVFYLIPVFFPNLIWLGIAQVLFGMVGQFVSHVVATNIKLKTWYNPGMAAVILGHIPLGLWYFVEVYSQGTVTIWDWVFGVLALAAFVGIVMLRIGYGLMANRNTRWPFETWEMQRWDRLRRLARAGITPLPMGRPSIPDVSSPTR